MGKPANACGSLRLDWWRFAVLALITIGIIAGIELAADSSETTLGASLATALFTFSLIGFSAYRWHRLRVLASSGRIADEDLRRDVARHLRGPSGPFIVWVVVTSLLCTGVVACFAIASR